jgi:hypothetical protein
MGGYEEFLKTKVITSDSVGVEVKSVSPVLYDFQQDITKWALRRGRAAVFADTGLGKTLIQLEWAKHVAEEGPVLILAPLAVTHQTAKEAEKIGLKVTVARSQADAGQITITNYEMLGHFDVERFAGIVLDESSILKSYMGKIKQQLISSFEKTPWKLACTATPAPNDHMELGNHAEFLGAMHSNEMLSRWFINDASEAGAYRLKHHAVEDFWNWVASWATALHLPSDLGYQDDGFILQDLNLHRHIVTVDNIPPPEGMLFRVGTLSATDIHREMRLTAPDRAEKVASLVESEPDEPWLIWCNTNYEADELIKRVPDAVEVRGSDSARVKEQKLIGFSNGEYSRMITKPSVAGYGMNWQHCARVAFVGLNYSFERYYQAIRRSWRYGQKRPVECHVVCAESERDIINVINRKEEEHAKLQREMVRAMADRSIAELRGERTLVVDHETDVAKGDEWEMRLGDCVKEAAKIEPDSIGYSIFSPPFSNLYIYSDALADMGNSSGDEEFFEHLGYLAAELNRITIPGRVCSVHCKDLPRYKSRDGSAGLRDFPGGIIRVFEDQGWTFHSRVTIWKCPVTEMTRTKNHGLLYKQLRKDSAASRQGMADYLLTFRRWVTGVDVFPDPVTHTFDSFPLERWQRWASPVWDLDSDKDRAAEDLELEPSPVWDDINQFGVLNYRLAKDGKDEKHICPLQLDVIERGIRLWSNPGDLVFSPFAGIGSEGYVAVKLARRFLGVELKRSYFDNAVKHIKSGVAETYQGTLFEQEFAND